VCKKVVESVKVVGTMSSVPLPLSTSSSGYKGNQANKPPIMVHSYAVQELIKHRVIAQLNERLSLPVFANSTKQELEDILQELVELRSYVEIPAVQSPELEVNFIQPVMKSTSKGNSKDEMKSRIHPKQMELMTRIQKNYIANTKNHRNDLHLELTTDYWNSAHSLLGHIEFGFVKSWTPAVNWNDRSKTLNVIELRNITMSRTTAMVACKDSGIINTELDFSVSVYSRTTQVACNGDGRIKNQVNLCSITGLQGVKDFVWITGNVNQ